MLTGNTIPFWSQFNQNRTLSGSISLSVPIFDGFRTRFTVKNAKLNQQSLHYEKEKIKRERLQTVSQGEMEYQAAIEERSAILATYEANKINYEGISERYKVGKSSSIDLYKAMTEFNISEFRLITSSYTVFYKREFLMMINN
ncbi:TolC family protein [Sphingobacterium sp. E70]|nr:TolC family protein [Sphingobacterium sp. E70]ULT25767.1 TolC family protein [Sphingobacterium sp. E70]